MKTLLAMFFFFMSLPLLFAQIEINHIEEFKELIFNVQGEYKNSIGTAFIVGRNESHYFLATARHVIHGSQNAVLTSTNGTQRKATIVEEHDVHDLALLKTPIFPIKVDSVPIVTDLAMNDEVGFVSMKDSGKVLPSRGSGIVRDVTGESLSLIMEEVELGHSGSPLFSKDGIAGIITKNGRFIECLNIMLAKEIMDEWGEGLFEGILLGRKIDRVKLPQPGTILNHTDKIISIKGIEGQEVCIKGLINLVDGYLNTSWSCSGRSGITSIVWLEFYNLTSISKLKIYISDESFSELPYGTLHMYNNNNKTVVTFNSVLKHKERESDGYWFTYIFDKPVLATEVGFGFGYIGSESSNITFNEIQFYGIPL